MPCRLANSYRPFGGAQSHAGRLGIHDPENGGSRQTSVNSHQLTSRNIPADFNLRTPLLKLRCPKWRVSTPEIQSVPNYCHQFRCIKSSRFKQGTKSQFMFRVHHKLSGQVGYFPIISPSFSSYQLNAHFLYSITIYMLHYNPQHVSSSTLLIFRRINFIITASGIVILNRNTVRPFTESDDTRGCNNKVCPPEDEHSTARNMLKIIM